MASNNERRSGFSISNCKNPKSDNLQHSKTRPARRSHASFYIEIHFLSFKLNQRPCTHHAAIRSKTLPNVNSPTHRLLRSLPCSSTSSTPVCRQSDHTSTLHLRLTPSCFGYFTNIVSDCLSQLHHANIQSSVGPSFPSRNKLRDRSLPDRERSR